YDNITFQSSQPSVVAVTPDGRLNAVRAGKAVITARAGTASASVDVEVVSAIPATVTVEPGVSSVRTGDVVRFTAVVKDRTGRVLEGLTPRWSVAAVSGAAVGQIDAEGAFVAEEQGSYTVTASVGSASGDAG